MANDYFNHVANRISAQTRALDSQINNIADEIALGFDKLPGEAETVEGRGRFAVDAGAADAYVVTLAQLPTYTDGFNLLFRAQNANTGASTLDVNAIGVKGLVDNQGVALAANAIIVNQMVFCVYNSSNDQFEIL